ncbi:MAG: hypothetical protein JEZ11_09200 [Desulfobacterales bacterium]|nr:hypothetical protein [Desulfobacterales bacterium]
MTTPLKKVLITITENEVAPRFDLTSEVLIATIDPEGRVVNERTMVLPSASQEDLCHLILAESVDAVICSGIEDEYYQYMKWKRIDVIDSVIGPYEEALGRYAAGTLRAGDIFFFPVMDGSVD